MLSIFGHLLETLVVDVDADVNSNDVPAYAIDAPDDATGFELNSGSAFLICQRTRLR